MEDKSFELLTQICSELKEYKENTNALLSRVYDIPPIFHKILGNVSLKPNFLKLTLTDAISS